MKNILKIFFTIIMIVVLCTNTYATEFVEKDKTVIDNKITGIIESQMSHEEKELIKTIDGTVSEEPLLKIYNEIFWHIVEKSPKEIVLEAEKYSENALSKDYYIISDTPYKITVGFGKIVKHDTVKTPQYINDIITMSNQTGINEKQTSITGIYCFDATTSQQGIVVYILTQTETLVKYYDNQHSEAILFSENDFKTYASDYYEYITAYENNYNEFGEPIGGGILSFKDFIGSELVTVPFDKDANEQEDKEVNKQNKKDTNTQEKGNVDKIKDEDSNKAFRAWYVIVPCVLAVIAVSVVSVLIYRKKKAN